MAQKCSECGRESPMGGPIQHYPSCDHTKVEWLQCQHLWSMRDAMGITECLWCGKKRIAPLIQATGNTLPLK